MSAESELTIETQGLSKIYKHVHALQDLNLKVPRHSIFGFLGPNGAGKTTTIKLLLGLIHASSGSGKVFGYDIVKESVKIRQRIGYLAQDPRFYEHMTARETLRFSAGFFYTGPARAIEDRIQETLELVEIADKADRSVKSLSGGERQRLGIAQAQVNYPDLLILDEPAASLDPEGRRDVLGLMRRLRKHTTIFYSTHILDDVQRVSDMVAILNKGQLIAQAAIDDLLMGSGGIVFQIKLKCGKSSTRKEITDLPWVSSLKTEQVDGVENWKVTVTDEKKAQEVLLRLILADPGAAILEFGRMKYQLEEIFLAMVEGTQNER